jgi:hypothetical protein
MSGVNFDRMEREAQEAYREQARRRQLAGERATAEAEELAHRLNRDGTAAKDAAGALADQSVYIYRGPILLAHLPASSMWTPVETDEGMALTTMLLSPSQGHYVAGPSFKAGEWTFCGRGTPDGS